MTTIPLGQEFIEKLWFNLQDILTTRSRTNWGTVCEYKHVDKIPKDKQADLGILAWRTPLDILEESRRIFFRLTKQSNQTLIPLWDVMDEHPMLMLFHGKHYHRETPKVEAFVFLKYLFAQTVKITPCPVNYDAENAVFTNPNDQLQILLDLEEQFSEWEKSSFKLE